MGKSHIDYQHFGYRASAASNMNIGNFTKERVAMHNSFSYFIAHVWNKLPLSTKSAPTVQHFKLLIKNVEYEACQCQSCIL